MLMLCLLQVRSPSRPLLDMSRLLAHHPAKFDQSLPAAHWLHLPEVMIVMMMMMMMQVRALERADGAGAAEDGPR